MEGAFIEWSDSSKSHGLAGYLIDGSGCHIWTGALVDGYGQTQVAGRRHYVHRLRYEREIGPVPDGLVLDHYVCNNRACCNPHHVRPVTTRENLLRGEGLSARNAAKTHCKHGHPLSGENLVQTELLKTGRRYCLTCARRPMTLKHAEQERR